MNPAFNTLQNSFTLKMNCFSGTLPQNEKVMKTFLSVSEILPIITVLSKACAVLFFFAKSRPWQSRGWFHNHGSSYSQTCRPLLPTAEHK